MGFVMWKSSTIEAVDGIGMRMTRPIGMDTDKVWHIKKEVSLPTLGMFLVQTAGIIWFIATLNAQVVQLREQTILYAPNTEKIIRLEGSVENIKDGIAEIKGILRNAVPTSKRSEIQK